MDNPDCADYQFVFTAYEMRVLQAIADHGGVVPAAHVLGVTPGDVNEILGIVRERLVLPSIVAVMCQAFRTGHVR